MQVLWSSGKKAQVLEVQGERVTLRSEASFAPGTPAAGHLESPSAQEILVKVHGCRREGDGFVITGRLVSLTRELRATLAEGMRAGGAGSTAE